MQIFFIFLVQTNFGHHAPSCATVNVVEPELCAASKFHCRHHSHSSNTLWLPFGKYPNMICRHQSLSEKRKYILSHATTEQRWKRVGQHIVNPTRFGGGHGTKYSGVLEVLPCQLIGLNG